MMRCYNDLGATEHDEALYEMGVKEKEHAIYFQKSLEINRLPPVLEKFFGWGNHTNFNDVDLANKYSIKGSMEYCQHRK